MKGSVSGIWLLGIVVTFILLFSAYIAITVDYTQTFKLKNEVLNIIEKKKGLSNNAGVDAESVVNPPNKIRVNVGALQTINMYLKGNAYTATGYCPVEDDHNIKWYGVSKLNYDSDVAPELASPSKRYYYCFAKFNTGKDNIKFNNTDVGNSVYYQIRLFYKFEFPVLQEFLAIKVDGITNEIYRPIPDNYEASTDIYAVHTN